MNTLNKGYWKEIVKRIDRLKKEREKLYTSTNKYVSPGIYIQEIDESVYVPSSYGNSGTAWYNQSAYGNSGTALYYRNGPTGASGNSGTSGSTGSTTIKKSNDWISEYAKLHTGSIKIEPVISYDYPKQEKKKNRNIFQKLIRWENGL